MVDPVVEGMSPCKFDLDSIGTTIALEMMASVA